MRIANRAPAAALCVVVVIVCTGGLAATQSSHEAAWLNGAWEGTQHSKYPGPASPDFSLRKSSLFNDLRSNGAALRHKGCMSSRVKHSVR